MTLYRIAGATVDSEWPEFQATLDACYVRKERPICMCQSIGPQMYLSKVAGHVFIKRMPNSGGQHAPDCESYEPPAELSGLGQVLGSAIEENVDDGMTTLKLGFSLTKGSSRAAPTGEAAEADSVKTDGNKLTLRGVLHYLWDQAQFSKWTPNMQGKRTWYVVRKFLLQQAQAKRTKGQDLAEILYVPEPFRPDDKEAIAQRRMAQFARITGAHKGGRRLNMVIGEVKELGQSRYGYKVVLKHVPDCSFMLNEDMHKRLLKRFAAEMGLWDAATDVHLVLIGTFGVSASGVATLEEAALMACNEHWIPVESLYDKNLVDHLIEKGRRFGKGLRYNLPSSRPLASAVLFDTEPTTALYILPPGAEEDYEAAVTELIDGSEIASWTWRAGEQAPPELPPIAPAPYRPAAKRPSPAPAPQAIPAPAAPKGAGKPAGEPQRPASTPNG